MRRLRQLARIWLIRTTYWLACRLPLRDQVVLATMHGPRLSGNLAAVRAEIRRRPRRPRVVAAASGPRPGLAGAVRAAVATVRGAYLLATSRVFIVDDYYFPLYVVTRRPGTLVIQTWHASGAFKRMGHSLAEKSFGGGADLLSRVPIHANYDVCLVSSRAVAQAYAEAFRQPLDRFDATLGIPRTDGLFGDAARIGQRRARARYGLRDGRTMLLYAPTFRGDSIPGARHPELLDLVELRAALGHDHRLLLRAHPFVRGRMALDRQLADFVVDVSDHPDINDLMLVSDILITDYSSAIFEFALLERPIVFFAPDLAAYEAERGFYFDYRTAVPGPVFETTAEVADHVRSGRFDLERVRAVARASFDVADGHASARLVDRLVMPSLAAGRRRRGRRTGDR